ncbi:MAG: hypothetical protein CM15mV65_550 [Caudoviricetes sp.]|nr:MAG: hypothetical protein CM15mV65_550 [Caudoviricetes sp.]
MIDVQGLRFSNKVILEFDAVSSLELEDNSGFIIFEDSMVADELLSNRGLDNGSSDINNASA